MLSVSIHDWEERVIGAVRQTAETMLMAGSVDEDTSIDKNTLNEGMSISMTSENENIIIYLFSHAVGNQLFAKMMLGMDEDDDDLPPEEMEDALGEFINVIAGIVQLELSEITGSISFSLPKVTSEPIRTYPNGFVAIKVLDIEDNPLKVVVYGHPIENESSKE